MSSLRFTRAHVLLDGTVADAPLSIDGTRIAERGSREIDLSGCILAPGIVDVHGDAFDRHLSPRRGLLPHPREGLPMLAAELAACGITTAYLAQFWSWEGGMRGPDFARALSQGLADWKGPVDLRMQLRVETHMIADFNAIARFVRAQGIDYVSFNDHLPHAALTGGVRPERITGAALRARRAPQAHWALMRQLHGNASRVPTALAQLIAELPPVALASHDDDVERRETFAAMGVRIAEFPTALDAVGRNAVMGAPNVVRGGSHGRGVAASEVIAQGACQALASDYHYPAPLRAVRRLVAEGTPLPAAWKLVSQGPATLLGLTDRGSLEIGRRADLVILDAGDLSHLGTFAAGVPVWLHPCLAVRMIG